MKRNALIRIILWSLVIAILTTLMLGVGFGISLDRNRRSSHRVEESATEASMVSADINSRDTFSASSVRELDIEWLAGDIKIRPGNTDRITVCEDGVTDDKYAMVIRQDEDSLEIRFFQEKRNVIGIHNILDKDLTITVPMDWYCRSLEIEAASATVDVRDMTIGEVEISSASGACIFENCTVETMDMGTASGDVRFVGILNILDCDAASAKVTAILKNIPSRLDMDMMSGDLDLTLPAEAGFTLRLDSASGDFTTDFQTQLVNGNHVAGNGACRMDVQALSGDVTIQKDK